MKRRHLYLLLFSVPALLAALAAAFVVFGAAAGVLWLFLWGDDAWPPAGEAALAGLFGVTLLAVWTALLRAAFLAGKSQEEQPALNSRHVGLAAMATLLLVAAMVIHQAGVGNLGPRSDSEVCADYCMARGFAGSSMPPRNAGAPSCSCMDAGGRETAAVPLHEAAAARKP